MHRTAAFFGLSLLLAGPITARAQAPAAPSPTAPIRARHLSGTTYADAYLAAPSCVLYRLSWRGLHLGSEACVLNGQLLRYARDYTMDYEHGLLRLNRAPGGGILDVTYRTRPLIAAANYNDAAAALMRGAPEPLPARREGPALGLALSHHSVAAVGTGSRASVSTDTLHDQLLSGLRETGVAEQLASAAASGGYSYSRTDAVAPGADNDAREVFNSQLNLHPTSASSLQLNNYFSRTSLFAPQYEESERQRLQFQQTWGKSVVGLMWDRDRTDGQGVASSLDALSLSLTHPVTGSLTAQGLLSYENSLYTGQETRSLLTLRQLLGSMMEAQGSLYYRASQFDGNSLESGLSLFAHPGAAIDATLAYRRSDSTLYGGYQRFSAEANASVTKQIQVTGQVTQRLSDLYGDVLSVGMGMAARPTTKTLLEAAFSESTGAELGREQSETLRLSMDPSSALRVQLGWDLQTSNMNGSSQNGLWMVSIGGRRYVKLEGYSGVYVPVQDSAYADSFYQLEVRPANLVGFTGTLRKVATDADVQAVAGVGATLYPVRGVELGAAYRRPALDLTTPPSVYGRDFRLKLAPISGISFFGQYSEHPEDERGALLDETARSVGLETRLGSFALQGSVTDLVGPFAVDPGRRADLLASLSLTSGTRLYGGISQAETSPLDPVRRVYRAGISQTAGDAFFLLLEGQVGFLVDGSGNRTPSLDDTRAQARFGLRF